ncbi:MAG: hypothetical protein VB934_21490 [Polyangiaceae bacterium]
MKVDRLFHVLVLGGAALGAGGCADEQPDGTSGAGGGSSSATQASTGSGDQGAGGMTAGQGGAAQSTASGAGGSGAGGSGATVASSGAGPLTCSDTAEASDACGCPCCWMDNCLNTEPCCGGFCNAGNMGAGCCGG